VPLLNLGFFAIKVTKMAKNYGFGETDVLIECEKEERM